MLANLTGGKPGDILVYWPCTMFPCVCRLACLLVVMSMRICILFLWCLTLMLGSSPRMAWHYLQLAHLPATSLADGKASSATTQEVGGNCCCTACIEVTWTVAKLLSWYKIGTNYDACLACINGVSILVHCITIHFIFCRHLEATMYLHIRCVHWMSVCSLCTREMDGGKLC